MSDIKLKFKIEDLSPQVLASLDDAKRRALYAAGITFQKGATDSISGLYTAENKAVDTGRLRASISFITPEGASAPISAAPENAQATDALKGVAPLDTMMFGSNVEYAAYVHEGTHGMEGRPFLREGVDMTKDDLKDTITRIFKGEL